MLLFNPLQSNGRERSGTGVECLTQDRGAMGSSLTGVTESNQTNKSKKFFYKTTYNKVWMVHPLHRLRGHRLTIIISKILYFFL